MSEDQTPPTNTDGQSTGLALPTGSDSDDNVVSFHDAKPYPLTAQRHREYCPGWCKRVFVVEKTRMLECQDCKKAIDPFDYLMRWAGEGDRRLGALKELDATLRKKGAELIALKADVANAKAQLRRANAPLFHQNLLLHAVTGETMCRCATRAIAEQTKAAFAP